jgi:O-methyltransferase
MNIAKLTAPDFLIGKILVTAKSLVDIAALLIAHPSRQSVKLACLIMRVKPRFTMVKNSNLINLYRLVKKANTLRLAGDIVECGVWNGGSAAVMGVACREDSRYASARTIWLFDSFQGLPAPGTRDGETEKKAFFKGWNKGDTENVRRVFKNVGFPDTQIRIVPGWFDATLKTAAVDRIAVLHVDADWYDSVKLVLDAFYDKVVPGGFLVFDDYGLWQGCRQAVTDFFVERDIDGAVIKRVGPHQAYFQKATASVDTATRRPI